MRLGMRRHVGAAWRMQRRGMAILPQMPAMGAAFLRKEKKLRAEAERAVMDQQRLRREAVKTPQFSAIRKPAEVLRVYEEKRGQLTPRDAAAAYFALGRLSRNSAYRCGTDPLASHPRAIELRADVAVSAPYLPSRDLSNALLGAAYARSSDEALLSALCTAAVDKASTHFSIRDVASTLYALGRLRRRDGALLPALLSRVSAEAPLFHAIEMSLTASGLADLELAPPTALGALSRAAIPKMDQFGAAELPRLLAALSSLGWHDELLLRLATERLPLLLTDMEPKGLAATAAVLAAADVWIPSTMHLLAEEATRKAEAFSARHAAVTLASLGRMRWDHPAAVDALVGRILLAAERNHAEMCDLAICMRALSRADQPPGTQEQPPSSESARQPERLLDAATRLVSRDGPSLPPPPSSTRRHAGASGFASPSAPLRVIEPTEQPHLIAPSGTPSDIAVPANGALSVSVTPPAATRVADPKEEKLVARRDLAMLCNAAVQLGTTPPQALVQHVREVVADAEKEAAEALAAGETPRRRLAGEKDSGRAERRVRAKLSDALRRWDGSIEEVQRRDDLERWIENIANPTRNPTSSKRR